MCKDNESTEKVEEKYHKKAEEKCIESENGVYKRKEWKHLRRVGTGKMNEYFLNN